MNYPAAEIKRFLKTSLVILAGIILSDRLIGAGLKYLYTRQKSGLLYRTTYAVDSTKAEYIVLGSSRANHDYDPRAFEKVLNSNFYNCGRDKQGLLYSCAVLSAILDRYRPKYIIIDIRPDEFTQSDEGTLTTLLPYYRNKAVRPFLNFNGRFESVKLLSAIYPYNSLLTNLVAGLDKNWKKDYQGYIPLHNIETNSPLTTFREKAEPDRLKIREFYNLLRRLNREGIATLLVISPIRYQCNDPITTGECRLLAKTFNNLSFLNFTNQPGWFDFKDYSDNNHLNYYGAARYSAILAGHLLQNINKQQYTKSN